MAITAEKTEFKEARHALGKSTPQEIIECLNRVNEVLSWVVHLLGDEINIKSIEFLKSKYSLVTLAYYVHKNMNYKLQILSLLDNGSYFPHF